MIKKLKWTSYMQAPSAVVPLDPLGRCSGRPMERTEPEKGERKKGRTKKGMFESAKEKREATVSVEGTGREGRGETLGR